LINSKIMSFKLIGQSNGVSKRIGKRTTENNIDVTAAVDN